MSIKLPDTRSMLPSAARAALTAYLLERLEASPLNSYADPTDTYATALGEMDPNVDGYAWLSLDGCWQAARAEYDRKHPKEYKTNANGTGISGAGVTGWWTREGVAPGPIATHSMPLESIAQCSCERLGITPGVRGKQRCPACPKRETNG